MLYFRYLSLRFLKMFFIIFLSLELFYVGVDFLVKSNEIPDSANLVTLFIVYDAMYASSFLIPIGLILTQILYQYSLSVKNELIALHSIGYSRKTVLFPSFIATIFIVAIFILLNTTQFAYSKDKLDEITKESNGIKIKSDFFVRYQNSYIYFGNFYPLLKKAENIKIYEMNEGKIKRLISAKKGIFGDDKWMFFNVTETNILDEINSKVDIVSYENKIELVGFKPNVFDRVYDMQGSMSIRDAYEAIGVLQEQNINTSRVLAALFIMLFSPIVPLLFNTVIYYYLPLGRRDSNLVLYSVVSLFGAVMLWGLLFILGRLSIGGVVSPELAVLFPFVVISLVSFGYYAKIR